MPEHDPAALVAAANKLTGRVRYPAYWESGHPYDAGEAQIAYWQEAFAASLAENTALAAENNRLRLLHEPGCDALDGPSLEGICKPCNCRNAKLAALLAERDELAAERDAWKAEADKWGKPTTRPRRSQ